MSGSFPESHPLTRTLLESLVWRHRTDEALKRLLDLSALDGTAPLWLAYLERTGRAVGSEGTGMNQDGGDTRVRRSIETRLAVHRRQIQRISEALENIPWVVLKGEPLSIQLFDEPGLRESSDVDILVARSDFEKTVSRLRKAGYRGDANQLKEWTYNQLALYPSGGGLPVEVHWRIARPVIPAPKTPGLLERRKTIKLPLGHSNGDSDDAIEVAGLGLDDLLMHLAYHFHQHHGMLKGLVDITAWIDCFGTERALDVRHRMRHEYGTAGLLDWALDTLDLLTGARIGPGSDDPFVHAWSRWSARQIRRRYRELEDTDDTMLRAGEGPQSVTERIRDFLGKVVGTGKWSMGMFALDRWKDKITAGARAGVYGPHRLGRALERLRSSTLALRD